MKAIRQHVFGGPEQLVLEEVPDPQPGQGQVRIRVESAGVHLLDTLIRQGVAAGPIPPPALPMTPGREVAGIVDEVGPGVDLGWLGRRAVTDLGAASGGYAELALALGASLHDVPDGLSSDEAVAMIGTGRTTQAILEVAAPTGDDIALVTAAAGGIGTLLVQALVAEQAVVAGVAGGHDKVALVDQLGATLALDYLQPDWPAAVRAGLGDRPVTLVLDGVGGEIGRQALELLGVGGRLVMFGTAAGEPTRLSAADLYERGITASAAIGRRILQRPGGLRPLETRALAAAASGHITPVVGRHFPLADAAAAHTAIQNRQTHGKTVLHPHPPDT